MLDFMIRPCTPIDAARVAELAARLFTQAYGPTHPEPELSRYLVRSFDVQTVAEQLRDPTVRILIVEDLEGTALGYAHIRETIGPPPHGVTGTRPAEIVRFYVDAEWQGTGMAQALMAACERETRAMGAEVLWLSVWQEALRPQAFYRRAGFEIVGTT